MGKSAPAFEIVGNCGSLIVKDPGTELAFRHFHYLVKCFQLMCASDEFDFLPRARRASQNYDQVDNLNAHEIERELLKLPAASGECTRFCASRPSFSDIKCDFSMTGGLPPHGGPFPPATRLPRSITT